MSKNVGDIVRVWNITNSNEVLDDFFEIKEKTTREDIFTFPRVMGDFYKVEGFMYGKVIQNIREKNMILIKSDERFLNELLDAYNIYLAIENHFNDGDYLEKMVRLKKLMKKKFPKKKKAKNV